MLNVITEQGAHVRRDLPDSSVIDYQWLVADYLQ